MPPLARRLLTVVAAAWIAVGSAAQAGCPTAFELEVVELVNLERALHDLPALAIDDRLQTAAQRHADDMALNNFMSHEGSNGSTFGERIRDQSYAGGSIGENVAAGYTTPASVVTGWMNSDGHRANILRESFYHIGVGQAFRQGTTYGHYWSQSFGGGDTLVSECAENVPEVVQADCQDDQLAALGRLCKAQLACHARHAKSPAHPSADARMAKCLAKSDERFARRWNKARDEAAAALTTCHLADGASATSAERAGESDALVSAVVSGQDPAERADGKLRARLLAEAARLCAADFRAASGGADRTKARARFDIRAEKAEARAAKRGVAYDGAAPDTLGDDVQSDVDSWMVLTAPG